MSAVEARAAALPGATATALPATRLLPARLALAGIALLAAVLNLIHLDSEGYANTYYAAAVKSMLLSWHNFFFVSFDPAGFVAVDKPPLGLWLEAASAKLLGFSGVSILLPQAIAGISSVLILYALVAHTSGRPAGLFAALALAITPIAVVDNRNNTSDSVLILLLLAAWAVTRAVESGRLRWLLLGGVLVGLGFNIKELEAYLILPALGVMYALGSPRRPLTRLGHLVLAGLAVLIVSFAWILAVDLTPPADRPYVSDSGTNSELSLALGYNGFGRLAAGLASHLPMLPLLHVKLDFSIVPAISAEIGNPSALRLIEPAIGGQASWLLPLALLGLLTALGSRPYLPLSRRRVTLLFWATWLLTLGIFFSVARFYHLYYLNILGPAVAAPAGIGLVALWHEYRRALAAAAPRLWDGWLLPIALVITGGVQAHLLGGYAGWNDWLRYAVPGVTLLIATVLVLGRLSVRFLLTPDFSLRVDRRAALAATALGALALLAAPSAFAAQSIADGNGAAWLPQAGPSVGFGGGFGGSGFRRAPGSSTGGPPGGFSGTGFRGFRGGPPAGTPTGRFPGGNGARRTFAGRGPFGGGGGGGALTFAGTQAPTLDPKLLRYLAAHRGGTRYLVATPTSSYASLFILQTGQPVLTMGGYQGWDRILTSGQLAGMVSRREIRFFLLSGAGGRQFRGPGGARGFFGGAALPAGVNANLDTINDDLTTWVTTHCRSVPTSAYTTSTPATGADAGGFGPARDQSPGRLYDCAPARGG